ncbi:hypothetical protein RJ640_023497 [Escallonia rubra]|uniref:Wax synthase domain-containing protein n=1 Tax=Escallonia rubra TaxID=112253 RepID=A0AA88QIJ8_9ASTE|nr:hypothetical protein RJ640_023497 [Escallonia rubra]
MEGEISNFIMVWASIYASICYCYGIAKSVPEGVARLFAYLPVVILFIILPFNLYSIHLGGTTALFITWLANFKILLFAFGMGPLSDPSLPLSHFFVLACFPIEVQANPIPKYPQGVDESPKFVPNGKDLGKPLANGHTKLSVIRKTSNTRLKPPSYYVKKALLLPFLVSLTLYKDHLSTKAFMVLHCMYIFLGLECMFAGVATLVHVLLGLEFEAPFDDPYLSNSLQDFWGRRWNRIVSSILRSAVYNPILRNFSRTLGIKRAFNLAILVTFFVSALMHELMFYYMGRTWSKWGCTRFFVIQGLCYVVEDGLRRKFTVARPLPRLMTGVIIFGFEIILFSWLVIPELLGFNADVRALEEYMALVKFMMSLGQAWKGRGYYLLVNVEASWTKLNKVMRSML